MSLRPTITLDRDRQLWIIARGDWAIPIHTAPCSMPDGRKGEYVAAAVVLNGPQYAMLNPILKEFALDDFGVYWVVKPGTVEKLATQAPGITAEIYLKWPGVKANPCREVFVPVETLPDGENVDFKPGKEPERFLRRVAETGLVTLPQLKVIWAVIQTEAARYLYQSRKPLDMGFCVLHAVPFRATWKAKMISEFPELISVMKLPKAERAAALASMTIGARLRSTDMIEFDPNAGVIGWTIEAVPTKSWLEWVKTHETRQLAAQGPVNYVHRWSQLIRSTSSSIYEVLSSWCDRAACEFAALDSGRNGLGQMFCRAVGKGRVRKMANPQPDTQLRYSDPTLAISGPESEEDGVQEPENVSLPPMPAVRLELEHLRDAVPDVGAGAGSEGAIGLRVPDQRCQLSPAEGLLASGQ
jgi:hypothetical protein